MDIKLIQGKGFTILELVIVIAIISILAVVEIPKMFNISSDAQADVIKSIAGTLSSANAENYAIRTERNTNGSAVKNCTSVANLLQGGLPVGYKITSAKVAVNTSVNCTVKGPSSTKANFIATGIL